MIHGCSHGHVHRSVNARSLEPDELVPRSHRSSWSVFTLDWRPALFTVTVKHANCELSRVKRCRYYAKNFHRSNHLTGAKGVRLGGARIAVEELCY